MCLHSTAYLAPAPVSIPVFVTHALVVGAMTEFGSGASAGVSPADARFQHPAVGAAVGAVVSVLGSAAPVAAGVSPAGAQSPRHVVAVSRM